MKITLTYSIPGSSRDISTYLPAEDQSGATLTDETSKRLVSLYINISRYRSEFGTTSG